MISRAAFAFLLVTVALHAQTNDLAERSHQAKKLMSEGRFAEAIPIYQSLVRAVPGNPGLILNLGMAEQMAGQPRQAIPQFEAVLKLDPENIPALTLIAEAYQNTGKFDSAAATYRKLTALNATDPQSWYGLGKAYESLATSNLASLSKSAPQSPYVAALLADSRLQRRQYRSAFFFYRQAQAKLPTLLGLHAGLANIYQDTGHQDWATAEQLSERRLLDMPCTAKTAECRFRMGDYLAVARAAASAPKPDVLFWAIKADNQLARDAFTRLGELPDSVEVHALRAEILHGHGQDAEATAEWRAALSLAPGDVHLKTELARSLFLAHKYDEVMPLLNELLVREPDASDLNFMLGESLWRTQRPENAVPYLKAALRADPEMLPAHAAIGMVYGLLNRPAEAVPHLEKALSIDDDGSLHYSLARAYQAAGKTPAAQKTMEQYQRIKQKNQQINDQLAKEAEITAPGR